MDNPHASLSQGTLLVASPELNDPLYSKSVLIICEHTSIGSFGLVINKPLEVDFPEELSNIQELSSPKIQARAGGSMQPSQMMLLHSSEKNADQTLKLCDNVYLGGNLNFLKETLASDDETPNILLLFGYTGWTSGELEKEYMKGLWYPHKADAKLIFETPPDNLWRESLKQMGGKYASMAMIPDDLSQN